MASNAASRVAIEVADRYQIGLGDAQRLALQVAMGLRDDGRWAARTFGDNRPRQQGKNNLIEVREITGLTELGEQLILHTAHEFPTANEAFLRMEQTLMNWDALRALVDRPRYANDEKGFDMLNGGRIRYRSRTKGAGKGFAECDLVVYDESQEILDAHLRALGPTGLANPNSQKWWAGTGGLSTAKHWWAVRRRALEHKDGQFGYVEHSAQMIELLEDGRIELTNPEDNTDPNVMAIAMPRLGDGLVTLETAMELLEELGAEMFGLEALNLWEPEPDPDGHGPIDPRQWALLAETRDDRDEYPQIVSDIRLAFAVSKDARWSTFAVAGRRSDGMIQVEVIDRRPQDHWVPARAAELAAKHGALRIRSTGPSAELIADIEAHGTEVVEVPSTDYSRATGSFIRKVNAEPDDNEEVAGPTIRHLGNRALNQAVTDTRTRKSSDGKMWDIGSTDTDTGPLEAVTLAAGAVPEHTAVSQDLFVVYGDE